MIKQIHIKEYTQRDKLLLDTLVTTQVIAPSQKVFPDTLQYKHY